MLHHYVAILEWLGFRIIAPTFRWSVLAVEYRQLCEDTHLKTVVSEELD